MWAIVQHSVLLTHLELPCTCKKKDLLLCIRLLILEESSTNYFLYCECVYVCVYGICIYYICMYVRKNVSESLTNELSLTFHTNVVGLLIVQENSSLVSL